MRGIAWVQWRVEIWEKLQVLFLYEVTYQILLRKTVQRSPGVSYCHQNGNALAWSCRWTRFSAALLIHRTFQELDRKRKNRHGFLRNRSDTRFRTPVRRNGTRDWHSVHKVLRWSTHSSYCRDSCKDSWDCWKIHSNQTSNWNILWK